MLTEHGHHPRLPTYFGQREVDGCRRLVISRGPQALTSLFGLTGNPKRHCNPQHPRLALKITIITSTKRLMFLEPLVFGSTCCPVTLYSLIRTKKMEQTVKKQQEQ